MNNGKEVCKRLKKVRREIAEANDIRLIQEECTHKGDCMGTCPRCEQEVQYLERELSSRRRLGKAVSIIGIAAITGTLAVTSCIPSGEVPRETLGGEPPIEPFEGDPAIENDSIPNDSIPEDYVTAGIAPE